MLTRKGNVGSRCVPLLASALALLAAVPLMADDSKQIKSQFVEPHRDYSTGPLWVWNDRLTERQIVETLEDMAGERVRQVWVHPRPGLMTPYLSEEWFRMWKVALREAKRLDMNVWIYDENSYPSGFAGGLVPEAMPESRGKGLIMREVKGAPKWNPKMVSVYRLVDRRIEDLSAKVRAGKTLPKGPYLVAEVRLAGSSPWFGGKYYVDLLMPGVVERFIEITMDAYTREIGEHFGKRVPGVFTDEPHLRPAGGVHWSDHLPKLFQERWGYSLVDHLPCLYRKVGDWKRVRHHYYRLLLEQFIACWAKPMHDFCARNDLEFTGHYWEHGWPQTGSAPDNMAMYAWHQRPAIDCLMNEYQEHTHAQFGNARAVRELASVANQLDRDRTLCEAYGAGGWDLRFEDMKRIGDWLYVLGVNTLNEHLSYITIRGARKRDHPQSFSYHTPWWHAYDTMASYFTRLSLALSAGKQIHDILVIEPTGTAWIHNAPGAESAELKAIGVSFQDLVRILEREEVEYDIGCEDIIERHGSLEGATLRVGARRYKTVVIPRLTETLYGKTMDLLEDLLKAGGTVVCCGDPPERVDGEPSPRGARLAQQEDWQKVDAAEVPAKLLARPNDGFAIQRAEKDGGILFHHRRKVDDGEILFLVNTSIDAPSRGRIIARAKGVERWDLKTGQAERYAFKPKDDGVVASFDLPPCGSLLLFLSKTSLEPATVVEPKVKKIASSGPPKITRRQPNVLVLDYVDVRVGDETKKNTYFYEASRWTFRKHGLRGNPWDSAVQFRDELIKKTFVSDSGFEATYRFAIEGEVPAKLWFVLERADLYTITCNGKKVIPSAGQWWLDKAFGKVDLSGAVKSGENAVTIKANPLTIYHELESAYLVGGFGLKATDKGFAVVADTPLKLGPWNEQAMPFYGDAVAYTQRFDVASKAGRWFVKLPKWYGSVAEVFVNGTLAGRIFHRPWECDVTTHVKRGANTIEVRVIGTLKNTLGPHHGKPPLGRAWPAMFRKGPNPGPPPGKAYHTVGYGLFAPCELECRMP